MVIVESSKKVSFFVRGVMTQPLWGSIANGLSAAFYAILVQSSPLPVISVFILFLQLV